MVNLPFATHKYFPHSKRKNLSNFPPSQSSPTPSSSSTTQAQGSEPARPAQPAFTLPPVPELQAIAGVAKPPPSPTTPPTRPPTPLPPPAYLSAPIPVSGPTPAPVFASHSAAAQASAPIAISDSSSGPTQPSESHPSTLTPHFHHSQALEQSQPQLPAGYPFQRQAAAEEQASTSAMPPSFSFWPQYNYVPYPPPWANYPQQTYMYQYQYPQQSAPVANPARNAPLPYQYIYSHQRVPPAPTNHPIPPNQPRPNIWYGRTRAQIDADNVHMAARPNTGANAPHEMKPEDPGNDRLFWVVELNGTHSLHNYVTIENCKKPGKWMQNPTHGNLYFVRTPA